MSPLRCPPLGPPELPLAIKRGTTEKNNKVNKTYAGSGLPQGPFLENTLFPLKVGFRWVFANRQKWVQSG